MKEYGGYIELDTYRLPMLHDDAIALNCGRNCLAYLIEAKGISKIKLPYFLCDSVIQLCKKMGTEVSFYTIDEAFLPELTSVPPDEWLYLVNYYGQLTAEQISGLRARYGKNIIIDQAQAYFEQPLPDTDTLYTCRKFFGVADGGFLYTDKKLDRPLSQDESFERMHFLLGRFERTASEFYQEYTENNHMFAAEPVKRMSRLTENLLHAVDYDFIRQQRTENFMCYHQALGAGNQLSLRCPEGAFAYPLLLADGKQVRKKLQQKKIYIPLLWPAVLELADPQMLEYHLAENILPLPCDQRYEEADIRYIIQCVTEK